LIGGKASIKKLKENRSRKEFYRRGENLNLKAWMNGLSVGFELLIAAVPQKESMGLAIVCFG
jgi:hypothetical protein